MATKLTISIHASDVPKEFSDFLMREAGKSTFDVKSDTWTIPAHNALEFFWHGANWQLYKSQGFSFTKPAATVLPESALDLAEVARFGRIVQKADALGRIDWEAEERIKENVRPHLGNIIERLLLLEKYLLEAEQAALDVRITAAGMRRNANYALDLWEGEELLSDDDQHEVKRLLQEISKTTWTIPASAFQKKGAQTNG